MILWGMRLVMFLGYAGIAVLVTSAVAHLLARHWGAGLGRLGLVLLMLIASLVAMGLLAGLHTIWLHDGAPVPRGMKAQVLAEAISTQMNWAAAGVLGGIIAGLMIQRRRRRTQQRS